MENVNIKASYKKLTELYQSQQNIQQQLTQLCNKYFKKLYQNIVESSSIFQTDKQLCIKDNYMISSFYFTRLYNNCINVSFTNCVNITLYNAPQNVIHLSIKDCKLESISGIKHMKDLQSLNLSDNALRDVIELVFLPKLIKLDITKNRIIIIEQLIQTNLDIDADFNKIPTEQLNIQYMSDYDQTQKPLTKSESLFYKRFKAVLSIQVDKNIQDFENNIDFERLKTQCTKMLQHQLARLTRTVELFVRFLTDEYGL
ncbi:Leucine-rich_repeat domain superfamily [Hexamita inflata]|uniref:Leucine-rich repeat domain superfamily n=1 Tax=Hexamita inflata TaxID=28002 RepID=A0AA86TQ70_9EUKA|nr:Leucine-rich repeat domain superfamily [Hexamita inflata]